MITTFTRGDNPGASHETLCSNRVCKITDKGLTDKERAVAAELSSINTVKYNNIHPQKINNGIKPSSTMQTNLGVACSPLWQDY